MSMRYVKSILRPDEHIVAVGRMHWIVCVPGILILSAALVLAFLPLQDALFWVTRVMAALFALLGLKELVAAWIDQWTTEIAVTPLRVIQKRGLIRRETGEMNMQKVESVTVDQSILGRILNYGTVNVRGTGSGIEGLEHIANPLALRNAIVAG